MNSPVFQVIKEFDFSYIEKSNHGSMTRPHYHNGYEIYLQTEGERELFLGHNNYLLKPGTICIITPHLLHSTHNRPEYQIYSRYLFNFSKKIFYNFMGENELDIFLEEISPCIIQLDNQQLAMVIAHINNIYDYWSLHLHNITRGKKLAYIEIYRMLDHLIRLMQSATDLQSLSNLSVISDSEIYNVLYYIDRHYFEDIHIDDMFRLSHMSQPTFYRAFKKITGDSFHHYLNQCRAVKAHALISDGKLSLQSIAENTGFSSTAHMTRVFKQIHGVSPFEYRHMF